MTVTCPYCKFNLILQNAKPGRYKPTCSGCKQRFVLLVTAEEAFVKPMDQGVDRNAETGDAMPAIQSPVSSVTAPPRGAQPSAMQTAVSAPATPGHGPEPRAAGSPRTDMPDPAVSRLGGYEIKRQLGAGGMGSVYLAKQISLDRDVAVKVLAPVLASDAQFVARFTREAYAAAQLVHPNVVQIYDIGQEDRTHFFAMELVKGQSLGGLLEGKGTLEPDAAVALVLQAARGLRFAHEQGMVHRDIKPENLLLGDDGTLKVADLGLVKRGGGTHRETAAAMTMPASNRVDQTHPNAFMGTPAYMPPEQASDAATVDQRADIYSLGCTLYHLLVGRPPFVGKTVAELITKHQREAITPIEKLKPTLPKNLSAILQKMLAKRPEDRYTTMRDAITAMEHWLGVSGAAPLTAGEKDVAILHAAAADYTGSYWATIRRMTIASVMLALAIVAAIVLFSSIDPVQRYGLLGMTLGVAALGTLLYQLFVGLGQRTVLFTRLRSIVLGASVADWAIFLVASAIVVAVLYVLHLHWWWLGGAMVAAIGAAMLHYSIDPQIARERAPAIDRAESILREHRLRGIDEMSVRQFVAKNAGERWEQFYEALFGYEEMLRARRLWGNVRGMERKKHAAWRDPILAWANRKLEARRIKRERRVLEKVEQAAMRAAGKSESIARSEARDRADDFVRRAATLRGRARSATAMEMRTLEPADDRKRPKYVTLPANATLAPPGIVAPRAGGLLDADLPKAHDVSPEDREHGYIARRYGSPIDVVLSARVRLILGAILLVLFVMWMQKNGGKRLLSESQSILSTERVDVAAVSNAKSRVENLLQRQIESSANATPLNLPFVPAPIDHALSGYTTLLAGLMLIIGSALKGRVVAMGVIAAAAIALLGHMLVPQLPSLPVVGDISPFAAPVLGSVLWLFCAFFLREIAD